MYFDAPALLALVGVVRPSIRRISASRILTKKYLRVQTSKQPRYSKMGLDNDGRRHGRLASTLLVSWLQTAAVSAEPASATKQFKASGYDSALAEQRRLHRPATAARLQSACMVGDYWYQIASSSATCAAVIAEKSAARGGVHGGYVYPRYSSPSMLRRELPLPRLLRCPEVLSVATPHRLFYLLHCAAILLRIGSCRKLRGL